MSDIKRVLCFDVDGTLTNKSGLNLELLALLRDISKHTPVIINSSRSIEAAYAAAKDWGLSGLNGDSPYILCQNGGLIYTPAGELPYELLVPDREDLLDQLARLNDLGLKLEIAEGVHHLTDLTLKRCDVTTLAKVKEELLVDNLYCITDNHRSPIMCFHRVAANKGSGLLKFLEKKNWLQADVYYFGDADNDLPVPAEFALRGMPLSFIAPSTSTQAVKSVATYLCRSDGGQGPLEFLKEELNY